MAGIGRHDPVPIFAQDHDPWSLLPVHDQHQGPCDDIEKGISTFQCRSPAFQPGAVNPVGLEFVGGVTGELQTAPPGWDIALEQEAILPV